MRIGISALLTEKGQSGIGQYTLKLIESLAQIDSTNSYVIFGIKGDATLEGLDSETFTLVWVHRNFSHPFFNVLWHWLFLPWCAFKFKLHLIHLPTHRRLCVWSPVPTVTTVHDLAAIHQPEKYGVFRHWYMKTILSGLLNRTAFIITVSQSTLGDILHLEPSLGKKAAVVYNGLDHDTFHPLSIDESQRRHFHEKYKIVPPFILYVSRIEHPGKNHIRLLEAFSLIKNRHTIPHSLVLVGGPWNGAEAVYEAARTHVYSSEIHFAGFVRGEDLPWLYNQADLVVCPSLWEGFGFPVIEAMACGALVVCSNVGSLPEVTGGLAQLFNPQDPEDIAEAMVNLTAMKDVERGVLRAKGKAWAQQFSWEKTASQTLTIYKKVGLAEAP